MDCLIISAVRIVGEIASIYTIGYDKQLDVIKQSMKRSLVIALYLIVSQLQFHTSALQFYLNQRQSVDKYRHIVTTLLSTFDGYLV